MRVIKVNASKKYEIRLGKGLLDSLGSFVKEVCSSRKAVLVTDSNVNKLYGKRAAENLERNGIETFVYEFPAGERSKNLNTYSDLVSFIAKNSLLRNDLVVALGGGVAGDIAGFAAATYMRGIRFVQVPTTLLAVIDSSVGGKTGIDLFEGKNLLGAFYQPDMVIADTDLLKTLPDEEIKNGMGELIKYGILTGGELWELIERGEDPLNDERMPELCVNYKRDIVEKDEHEASVRKLLNLGHTAGHAIEKLNDYALTHGICVAFGIAVAARSALYRGALGKESYDRIMKVLERENMPTSTDISPSQIISAALNDKKSKGKSLTMVVIRDVGDCGLEEVPIENLGEYFVCR
ncbi:MAG TPA: 3-dehydroquinate synthase [Clostridia bacterium]|jgi:3-dehydroquinate synthase|nr:3-dehydroquinate synthase [Clostridia bacterium]